MKNIFKKKEDYDETTGKPFTLFKILLLVILIFMVLTYFINPGQFVDGVLTDTAESKLSILRILVFFISIISNYMLEIFVLLMAGGFYGVVSKTSGYKMIVDKLGKVVEKYKVISILVVSLFFALLSGVASNIILLFVFVPFVITVFSSGKVDKIAAFSATIGSSIIGIMAGSVYTGFGMDALYTLMKADLAGSKTTYMIIFIIAYVLLNMFAIMRIKALKKPALIEDRYEASEESEKTSVVPIMLIVLGIASTFIGFILSTYVFKEVEALLILFLTILVVYIGFFFIYFKFSKNSKKTKKWPLVIALSLLGIMVVLSTVNWSSLTENTFLTDFDNWTMSKVSYKTEETSSTGVTVEKDVPILGTIIGDKSELRNETGLDMNLLLVGTYLIVFALVIGLSYGFKVDNTLKYFGEGVVKMLGPVLIYILAMLMVLFSYLFPIFNNIVDSIVGAVNGYSIIALMIVGIICAFFCPFPYYFGSYLGAFLAFTFKDNINSTALIINSMYGLAQFVMPTGMILFTGLSYCKLSYSAWLKYIWRFLLGMLVALVIVFLFLG